MDRSGVNWSNPALARSRGRQPGGREGREEGGRRDLGIEGAQVSRPSVLSYCRAGIIVAPLTSIWRKEGSSAFPFTAGDTEARCRLVHRGAQLVSGRSEPRSPDLQPSARPHHKLQQLFTT